MFAKKLLAIAVAGALGVVAGSAAAGNVVNNRAVEIVGAGAGADPLIAVEANRGAIINRLAVEHAATLASAGISQEAFRHALNSIRADQLLVASLVSSFAEITAIVSAEPGNGSALQRFVALSPRSIMSMSEVPIADAYLVRDGDMLSIVKAAQLFAQPNVQVVGYFVSPSVTGVSGVRDLAKDGSGTGAGSWIGFTGGGNQATGTSSAVAAGSNNLASGQNSFVGAGFANQANGLSSLVIGGFDNRATNIDAMVGAGAGNRATGARSVIVGGGYNFSPGEFSFIGGGGRDGTGSGAAGTDVNRDHRAYGKWSFIGGGTGNVAGQAGSPINFRSSAVVGGARNTASNYQAFVGAGGCNVASGISAVVAGGGQDADTGPCTFGNTASGSYSFIGGGFSNTASGFESAVLGGVGNTASGNTSVALGENATAAQANTFVFSDGTSYSSTVANTFNIRAANDIRVDGSTNIRMGSTTRQNITLWGNPDTQDTNYGIGVQTGTQYYRVDAGVNNTSGFAWFRGGTHDDGAFVPGAGGTTVMTLSREGQLSIQGSAQQHIVLAGSSNKGIGAQAFMTYARSPAAGGFGFYRAGVHSFTEADPGTGGEILAGVFKTGDGAFLQSSTVTGTVRALSFVATSDRAAKTAFAPIDPKAILAKVAAMPVMTWVYKHEGAGAVRHIGPVSQDFRKAFDLGMDDKSIATVDADGIAFAAIKGLNQLVKEKDAEIAVLKREMAAIKKKLGM